MKRSTRGTCVLTSPQDVTDPEPGGCGSDAVRTLGPRVGGELLGGHGFGCREVTVKCCGVAVTMPLGYSRAAPSSSEQQGTGDPPGFGPAGVRPAGGRGRVHRRPIPSTDRIG